MNASNSINTVLLKSAATFAVIFLTGFSGAADMIKNAEVAQSKYSMAVHEDDAYAKELIAGNFKPVIEAYGEMKPQRRGTFVKNNQLCVAYTLAKDIEKSKEYCESAVRISRKDLSRNKRSNISNYRVNVAIALTNRGVVLAMMGNHADAKRDFKAAIRNFRWMKESSNNLAYLEKKTERAIASL